MTTVAAAEAHAPSTRAAARAGRTRPSLILIGLLALTFIVYQPVLRHGFVNWDDQTEIYENPDFNPVTPRSVAGNWTHTRMTVYMPLTYTVWAGLAVLAHGAPARGAAAVNAFYFHLANVVFHAISVAIVFLLLRRLSARDWPAALGAAVFAFHPLQVEAVAWASGMYTVLSGALSLWALW